MPSIRSALRILVSAVCLIPAAATFAQTSYFVRTLGSGFNGPTAVAVDGSGNIFVADRLNDSVKEILAAGGYKTVKTLGGGFLKPNGVAVDGKGNIFVADTGNSAVKEIPAGCTSSACVTTLGAGFSSPNGVAVGGIGNVFVADTGHNAVKKILAAGGYTTVDTMGGGFSAPTGVAVDKSGNIFVADSGSNSVKQVPAACAASTCVTVLGSGFSSPDGVAVDLGGNVYVADSGNHEVKEILAAGGYTTMNTLVAAVTDASGVALAATGNVIVADSSSNAVKEVVIAGAKFGSVDVKTGTSFTSTLTYTFTSSLTIRKPALLTLGAPGLDFTDAGTGTCTTNGTSYKYSAGDTCTVDVVFNPKFAGQRNGAIVLKSTGGDVFATAFLYATGIAAQAAFSPSTISSVGPSFSRPWGLAVDAAGNVYVADTYESAVKKIPVGCATSACVTTLGGGFFMPASITLDGAGNIYVTDTDDSHSAVKEMPPGCASAACVTTLGGGMYRPVGIAVDGMGNVYVAGDWDAWEMPPGCASSDCVTSFGGFGEPGGIALDGAGNIYVTENYFNDVVEIPAGCASSACRIGLGGELEAPWAIAADAAGNVFVDSSAGLTEIPAGCRTAACTMSVGVIYALPAGVALDGSGNLYVETSGGGVQEMHRATPPTLGFADTPAGSTSTDSAQAVTVNNIGNANLNILNVTYAADFPEATGAITDCSASTTLSQGASCSLSIDFSPLAAKVRGAITPLRENIQLTDNSMNSAAQVQSVIVNGNITFKLPVLTSPAPDSTLSGSTATFTWDPGDATSFQFRLGTSSGSNDIYGSGTISQTSVTVHNLPINGEVLYARLGCLLSNGSWLYVDAIYTSHMAVLPFLTSPSAYSILSGSTATFTWDPGDATSFQFRIGTTGGANDIYGSGSTSQTSVTVHNLPTNGEVLYGRLAYQLNNGVWQFVYAVYKSGPALPYLISPAPNSALTGASQTFTWAANGATAFQLYVGTQPPSSYDVYKSGWLTGTSVSVSNIPANGEHLYVTLWYRLNGVWRFINYVCMESGSPQAPSMTSPVPGTMLAAASQTFTWDNPGSAATAFHLRVGTTRAGNDVYDSGVTKATSINVSNIPTTGAPLYVRLWYYINGTWHCVDYMYAEF